MAASRPLARAACSLSNVIRSNAALSSANRPSIALGRRFWWQLKTPSLLLLQQHRALLKFASGACGYCSQHVSYASSASHTCAPTMMPTSTHAPTSFHTPAFTHAHESGRRINRRTELDYEELRALQLAGDIALIDVRDPQELQNFGEIPGSLNIPLGKIKVALQLSKDEWEEEFHIEKPDQEDRNLVFYARGPNASSAAVEIAHRLGFKRSRHYIGGWEDYCKQTGRPLKKPQNGFASCDNYYTSNFDQYFL